MSGHEGSRFQWAIRGTRIDRPTSSNRVDPASKETAAAMATDISAKTVRKVRFRSWNSIRKEAGRIRTDDNNTGAKEDTQRRRLHFHGTSNDGNGGGLSCLDLALGTPREVVFFFHTLNQLKTVAFKKEPKTFLKKKRKIYLRNAPCLASTQC